jgi:carbon-monoxide dehydrogenase large subunit
MGLPGAGPILATDRVRYVGDSVAAVVAKTRYQAFDALDKIKVDYEVLPVVVTAEEAYKDGAPQLHDNIQNNLNALWTCGDKEKADKALENAEVIVTQKIINPRMINNPIEPRAALAQYDPATGDYTLWASTQSPFAHRLLLATFILGIPYNKLRVIAPDVGGSYGTKGYIYPDMPLVLFLAKELGRPVKWVDTRNGLMRSTVQGRDHVQYASLGGTKDGKITSLRCTSYCNLGAYPSTIGPGVATAMMGRSLNGMYDIENAFCEVYAVFTNTVPLGACRGSGRAEAALLMERLVDLYAAQIGKDPAQVRLKNLIPPDKFPYDNGLGWVYDSGNYKPNLERALEMVGYNDKETNRQQARKRGKRLGVGIGCFVAISGVGPSPKMGKEGMISGTWESATISVAPTGEVSVAIGTKPHGQSHETTFAQVAAEALGIDVDLIKVYHSDTKNAPFGQGSYGSRSFSVGGPAVHEAALKIVDKVKKVAAHIFEAPVEEVVYEDGKAYVKGNPGEVKTLQEIALALWYAWDLPEGMEPNLETTVFLDPPDFNYPFGTHAAVVEIDEETGQVDLVRYISVDDPGNVGNEMVVEGQIHGGIAHGVGQAFMEEAIYDDKGHLITDNLMEYAMPRANELPSFETDRTVTPTPHNKIGAKGVGELGTIGATAAISNAVCDALSDLGIKHIDIPLTPEKVYLAIREAKERTSE